jgi:hypothetical protein
VELATQPLGGAAADTTAVSATSAITQVGNGGTTEWFSTTDSGTHWTQIHMPCNDLNTDPRPGNSALSTSLSFWTTLTIGPDGTRWLVCGGMDMGNWQSKTLLVSTDGGVTWSTEANLETSGFAVDVYPESATVAWRSGIGADIYRTTDRVHWTDTTPGRGVNYATSKIFVAVDVDTALYFVPQGPNGTWTEYLTQDGGATWTATTFAGA